MEDEILDFKSKHLPIKYNNGSQYQSAPPPYQPTQQAPQYYNQPQKSDDCCSDDCWKCLCCTLWCLC